MLVPEWGGGDTTLLQIILELPHRKLLAAGSYLLICSHLSSILFNPASKLDSKEQR